MADKDIICTSCKEKELLFDKSDNTIRCPHCNIRVNKDKAIEDAARHHTHVLMSKMKHFRVSQQELRPPPFSVG